ncbi:MAG: leucyl aminopeptidase [Pseudomonadota bacterium]
MNIIKSQQQKLFEVKADLIAIGAFNTKDGFELRDEDGGSELDKHLNAKISNLLKEEGFRADKNSFRLIPALGLLSAQYLLVVGLGDTKKLSLDDIRMSGGVIAKQATVCKAKEVAFVLESAQLANTGESLRLEALLTGLLLGQYRFDRYKKKIDDLYPQKVEVLTALDEKGLSKALESASITALSQNMARTLSNTPANDLTPFGLVEVAKRIEKEFDTIKCEIWDKKRLAEERMNLVLAVAKGSAEDPYLIKLQYKPQKSSKKIALVGKGVVFDSGGLSLKSSDNMEDMKTDMEGGAIVLAVMKAIGKLKPDVEITAYIPAVENMPDGAAVRIGDVITARNGTTVEMTNTDAEGRLIMADALALAVETKPDLIIDVATLTGSALAALGQNYTVMLGNDQSSIEAFKKACSTAGEKVWQLPLEEEYKEDLTKGIADIKNSVKSKGQTIIAALFLHEFVGSTPWIHLDIASNHCADDKIPIMKKGSSGRMTRSLIQFLRG